MAAHDWTLVGAGIFHDFHNAWITEIRNALNGGIPARLLRPGRTNDGGCRSRRVDVAF